MTIVRNTCSNIHRFFSEARDLQTPQTQPSSTSPKHRLNHR